MKAFLAALFVCSFAHAGTVTILEDCKGTSRHGNIELKKGDTLTPAWFEQREQLYVGQAKDGGMYSIPKAFGRFASYEEQAEERRRESSERYEKARLDAEERSKQRKKEFDEKWAKIMEERKRASDELLKSLTSKPPPREHRPVNPPINNDVDEDWAEMQARSRARKIENRINHLENEIQKKKLPKSPHQN